MSYENSKLLLIKLGQTIINFVKRNNNALLCSVLKKHAIIYHLFAFIMMSGRGATAVKTKTIVMCHFHICYDIVGPMSNVECIHNIGSVYKHSVLVG